MVLLLSMLLLACLPSSAKKDNRNGPINEWHENFAPYKWQVRKKLDTKMIASQLEWVTGISCSTIESFTMTQSHSLMCLVCTLPFRVKINPYNKSKKKKEQIDNMLLIHVRIEQIDKQTKRTTNHRMISQERHESKACTNWSYRRNDWHAVSETKSKTINVIQ